MSVSFHESPGLYAYIKLLEMEDMGLELGLRDPFGDLSVSVVKSVGRLSIESLPAMRAVLEEYGVSPKQVHRIMEHEEGHDYAARVAKAHIVGYGIKLQARASSGSETYIVEPQGCHVGFSRAGLSDLKEASIAGYPRDPSKHDVAIITSSIVDGRPIEDIDHLGFLAVRNNTNNPQSPVAVPLSYTTPTVTHIPLR